MTIKRQHLNLAGFIAVLIVSGAAIAVGIVAGFDQKLLDIGFRLNRHFFPQAVTNDPVIVGINEKFLDSIDEPIALSHAYLSDFLGAVSQAGPAVVGLDLSLPEKRFDSLSSSRDPDIDFHKKLLGGLLQASQSTTVISAKVWDENRRHYKEIQVDYASVLGMQNPAIQPISSALFCLESDNRIRTYPGKDCQPDRTDRNFSSEIAAAAGVRKNWSGLINYQLGPAFNYIPIQDVLKLAKEGKEPELKKLFAGKMVLLGTILDDTDLLYMPVALAGWSPEYRAPGVLAHAQALRSMFNGGFIQPLPIALTWALYLVFALFWFGDTIRIKLPVFIAANLALLAACDFLLLQNQWLPPAGMLLTGLIAFGARSGFEGWQNFRDKQRLSRTFSGYVSPAVMKEIVDGGLDATDQGRKLPVCILFSDIRSFTTLSEHLPAEDVVNLLNRYFARMTAAVHEHGGTVDKFIGDGMMAFFGAPNKIEFPERHAFEAAQEMLVALAELNREFAAEGRIQIAIGVGLHSGEAVIGHIGSPERHEYTAIGDTVNIAARLESLCKEVGFPIVVSEPVAQSVTKDKLIRIGEKPLKGRSPILVYGWGPSASAADGAAEASS